MTPYEEWAAGVAELDRSPLLFAFENFHEPHYLGYALRCVEALGAGGVLLDGEWGDGEAVIAQSSSGAFDRLPLALLDDPRAQFKRLEGMGVESLLATAGAVRSFYDFNLRAPALIAVGGEFKGVSDEMWKACRHTAHLPMTDPIPSFPAGHAAAILASEVARQRRMPGPSGPLWPRKPSNASHGGRSPIVSQPARPRANRRNRNF
jgi:tRNA G18 (ribose-2'-O)-methylase SpoU